METIKLITIVQESAGAHARTVGEEYVRKVCEAVGTGQSTEEAVKDIYGGDSFSWVDAIQILIGVAQLGAALYPLLVKDPKRPNEEVQKEILGKIERKELPKLHPGALKHLPAVIEATRKQL